MAQWVLILRHTHRDSDYKTVSLSLSLTRSWSLLVSAWHTQPEGNLNALMEGQEEGEEEVEEGRERRS